MDQAINTKNTKWSLDAAHSEIGFKVRHLMISNVKGTFKKFDADIRTTHKDFTTVQVDLWIDAASIDTDDEKRDHHLRSADFFDVENFTQITFTTSSIEKPDKHGRHELWGELTMKGITKVIKLDVYFGGIATDPWGNEKAGFTVSGSINRSDWGLTWNNLLEAGGLLVGEEVSISCELELLNSTGKPALMELEAAAAQPAV
jgi:polyisoprenoid-binding protein YceI